MVRKVDVREGDWCAWATEVDGQWGFTVAVGPRAVAGRPLPGKPSIEDVVVLLREARAAYEVESAKYTPKVPTPGETAKRVRVALGIAAHGSAPHVCSFDAMVNVAKEAYMVQGEAVGAVAIMHDRAGIVECLEAIGILEGTRQTPEACEAEERRLLGLVKELQTDLCAANDGRSDIVNRLEALASKAKEDAETHKATLDATPEESDLHIAFRLRVARCEGQALAFRAAAELLGGAS